MILRSGLLALVALAATGSAAAQERARSGAPSAAAIQAAGSPSQARVMQRYYVRQCGPERLSVEFDRPPTNRIALVEDSSGPVRIAVCSDALKLAVEEEVNSLSVALAFMAYKPFAPFWPAAEAAWGADLGKLRQALRRDALDRSASDYAFRYSVRRNETARTISAADGLTAIGYFDEARARLDEEIAAVVARRAEGKGDLDFDLAMLAIHRASADMHQFGHAAAADFLGEFSRSVPLESDFAVNVIINRAAYLAESGRHDEAVELLEPAYRQFRAGVADADHYNISGSDREFAWILACAYSHKGEAANAARYAAMVTSAPETPQDPFLRTTKRSTTIKFRMYRCMDDPEGYYASWRRADEPILSEAWLEFQKLGTTRLSGMPRAWVPTRPEADELSVDYRQLPDRYLPALTRWRAAAAPGQ